MEGVEGAWVGGVGPAECAVAVKEVPGGTTEAPRRHRGSRRHSIAPRIPPGREDGRWKMEDGRWKMEDGRWKKEDGRWKMEDGRRKMEDGIWKVTDEKWKRIL